MPSKNRRRREQTSTTVVSQVAPQSLSIQPPLPPSANANEGAGSSQSYSLVDSRNVVIHDGQFNQIRGHHTNLVINLTLKTQKLRQEAYQALHPALRLRTKPITSIQTHLLAKVPNLTTRGISLKFLHKVRKFHFKRITNIYERHLTPKGRGFPLWIPGPNQALHIDYRHSYWQRWRYHPFWGIFLSLQHMPPSRRPSEPTVFDNDSHLTSASIKRSQTSDISITFSGIVFESSASEGAILTMPRGANSEDLGKFAAFRVYVAANVADWSKFVNGCRGREAKNGDARLVVGFDKNTSWGIATFSNQSTQNSCRLRFGPSEGAGLASAGTYAWELSGVAEVKAGPGSNRNDELRRDSDPPDIQFENQCLFVRTLNITLADDIWVDIHSSLDSVHVDP
ncbi:hypothetical protein BYT27DRAFT_7253807 [Phlegmacium glaucopus]|nr:hypothetical protein BYT27DRAFT_7253807 [Phlegmacium glaucopus]